MLDQFINQYTGQEVSFDHVPANNGQCVQLVALWCTFIGLPVQWANAAAWFTNYGGTFAQHWDKVVNNPNDPNQTPKPGALVIFSTSLPGSGGLGHIDIFVREVNADSWVGFDSNWGGKTAHQVTHSWAYVLGWMTPKVAAVVDNPTPTPIAVAAPSHPYTVEDITPKQIKVTKNPTTLWNLNDTSWDTFTQNPVTQTAEGTEVTVVAIAHHKLGGSYYMPDAGVAQGYNTVDCDDYVAPPPAPPPPPPPPTAAELPAAPLVPPGGFKPADKPLAPAPAIPVPEASTTFKDTYRPFRDKFGNVQPAKYVALVNYTVTDIAQEKHSIPLHQYDYVMIGGTFQANGKTYGRPQDAAAKYLWYGIPMEPGDNIIEAYDELYDTTTDTATRLATHTPTARDYIVLGVDEFENIAAKIGKVMDIIKPKRNKKG